MTKRTGAQALVQTLIAEGVDTVFGYPGGSIMPAYDALYDEKHVLRHVMVRHEQGAAHAAEGYAQATGKVGVCVATSGPGATNLLTGIANAMMDSTPIVCITGQVAEALLGTDAFQESPVIGMATPVTKWCTQVTSADEIPDALRRAFRIAQAGRPGPVLVDIAKNALIDVCAPDSAGPASTRAVGPKFAPDMDGIRAAAALLNSAQRPYVLVGHGVLIAGAQEELRAFVEKGDYPFASTLLGLGALPAAHPLSMGMLGMHGNYAANLLTNEADVILAIGMRFDDRVTGKVSAYAPQAKIIHIDIDAAEIRKIVTPEISIHSDAKAALIALLPLIEKAHHAAWHERFTELDEHEEREVRTEALKPTEQSLTMAEVIRTLEGETHGGAILVSDVGQHQMMAARYYRLASEGQFITSGGLGTMGFSLPAAIGAQVGRMDKQVIAVMGDGSAQMNIQELGTIMQEKVPVKIIILNNGYLGMVRQWQELFFDKRYSSVEMQSPDFVALAAAYGIAGACVSAREDLEAAIHACVKAPSAYLLEVRVRAEENVFPMIPGGGAIADIRLK